MLTGKPLRRAPGPEDGFTLVEVLVAVTMVAIMMVVLASALTTVSALQTDLGRARAANNVLQQEVELGMSAIWDDVMMAPTVPAAARPADPCTLGRNSFRNSAQSIKPTSTYVVDNTPIVVTRRVTWFSDGSPVDCTAPAGAPSTWTNDRNDLKVLTVTVQWNSLDPSDQRQTCLNASPSGGNRCRVTSVYLSKGRVPPQEIIAVPQPPGMPLDVALTVTGTGNAAKLNIAWTPPFVTGNANILGYVISVSKNDVPLSEASFLSNAQGSISYTSGCYKAPGTEFTDNQCISGGGQTWTDGTNGVWAVDIGNKGLTFTPLVTSTKYTVTVRAVNPIGAGQFSTPVSLTTAGTL